MATFVRRWLPILACDLLYESRKVRCVLVYLARAKQLVANRLQHPRQSVLSNRKRRTQNSKRGISLMGGGKNLSHTRCNLQGGRSRKASKMIRAAQALSVATIAAAQFSAAVVGDWGGASTAPYTTAVS